MIPKNVSGLVAFTLCENCTTESQRVFHWNGTTRIMDAVSLASSEEIKPSQIFFSRREAWDNDP